MIMNISTLFLLGAAAPLSNAWMVTTTSTRSNTITSTRLMVEPQQQATENGRRAFFRQVGALVGTTTTIVAGPWIARADDEIAVESSESSSSLPSPTDDTVLVAKADEAVTTTTPAEEPAAAEQVLVADAETKPQSDASGDVIEATFVENSKEIEASAVELNAKIEESIEAAAAEEEAPSVTAAPMMAEVKVEKPIVVASVDPNKIYQDLFDERKAVSSDAELDVFCKKLRGLIAADSNFADSFEAFLDKMSTASA